jgi:hypothetical protein
MNTNAKRVANADPRSLNSVAMIAVASKCNPNLMEETISRTKITPKAIIKEATPIPIINKKNTVTPVEIGETRQKIIKEATEAEEVTEAKVDKAVKTTTEEAEITTLVGSEETIDLFDLFL